MVCFKLLYMDNLWLVGDKGKKLHRTSAEQLRKKKKKRYKWFGRRSGSKTVANLHEMKSGRMEGNQKVGRSCALPNQQQTQWH